MNIIIIIINVADDDGYNNYLNIIPHFQYLIVKNDRS